jgi:hypothetical protein
MGRFGGSQGAPEKARLEAADAPGEPDFRLREPDLRPQSHSESRIWGSEAPEGLREPSERLQKALIRPLTASGRPQRVVRNAPGGSKRLPAGLREPSERRQEAQVIQVQSYKSAKFFGHSLLMAGPPAPPRDAGCLRAWTAYPPPSNCKFG